MNKLLKDSLVFLSVFFVILGTSIYFSDNFAISQMAMQRSRILLKKYYSSIVLHEPFYLAVNKTNFLLKEKGISISIDNSKSIVITTPHEIGTTAWALFVVGENGVVVGKYIISEDGDYRPCDAPLDEGVRKTQPTKVLLCD